MSKKKTFNLDFLVEQYNKATEVLAKILTDVNDIINGIPNKRLNNSCRLYTYIYGIDNETIEIIKDSLKLNYLAVSEILILEGFRFINNKNEELDVETAFNILKEYDNDYGYYRSITLPVESTLAKFDVKALYHFLGRLNN